jgi:hypothetical protein
LALILSRKVDPQGTPSCPVRTSRLGFDQPHAFGRVSLGQLRSVAENRVRVLTCKQFVAGDVFLSGELLIDELASNSQCSPRRVREALGAAQPDITRCCWPGHEQDSAGPVQHHERSANVRKPPQCSERDETVLGDADQTFQPVAYSGESDLAALHAHAVLDFEVAGLHPHAHAEAVDREYAAFTDGEFARRR